MTAGVHDFEIPHEKVKPTRDMVIIRLPLPPKFMGDKVKFEIPNVVRDLAQHNVQAGRIINMGPLAFAYKDGSGEDGKGVTKQAAAIGDWVIIRPFAGTLLQGGKITVNSGWRYVSSFQDVLAVVPAADMPDPATLLWTEAEADAQAEAAMQTQQPKNDFADNVRERVVYKP
jgi:hypothetical protein